MVAKWRKNKTDKIDVALFGTKQQLAKIDFDHIDLTDNCISFYKNVRDQSVVFDTNMTISSQITNMSASFPL